MKKITKQEKFTTYPNLDRVLGETEKAILVTGFWFPKSQVSYEEFDVEGEGKYIKWINIPQWLFEKAKKKIDDFQWEVENA